jgi:ABC-2 type transport system permease protein
VASWIRPGRYASLFYWSVGNSQLSRGVSVGDYAVLAVVGLCALAAAMLAFRRLDIH